MDDRALGVISTYYSHVSRLFVSNYATFFAVYLGFLGLLYAVSSRNEITTRNGFFIVSLLIMFFELLVLYRALQFARVLDEIDKLWASDRIIDVRERFWNPESWPGRVDRLYRKVSVYLTLILTGCIPVLTWFLPYWLVSPLTSEVGNTTITDWLTAIGTIAAVVVALFVAFLTSIRRWYNRPKFHVEIGNEEPFCKHTRIKIGENPDGTLILGHMSYWIRIRVKNVGRSVARGCEGKLVRISQISDMTDRTDFDPVVLHWVGRPHSKESAGKPIDINKREYEYLDVVFTIIDDPNHFHIPAEETEPRAINLSPPRENCYLHIVLYGANAEPLEKKFLLRNTGQEYDSFELV